MGRHEGAALAGAARAQRPAGDRRRRLRPVVGAAAADGAARRVRLYARTEAQLTRLGVSRAPTATTGAGNGRSLHARKEPHGGCGSAAGESIHACALCGTCQTTYHVRQGIHHAASNIQPDSAGSACRCFPVSAVRRVVLVRELHAMCSREPCGSIASCRAQCRCTQRAGFAHATRQVRAREPSPAAVAARPACGPRHRRQRLGRAGRARRLHRGPAVVWSPGDGGVCHPHIRRGDPCHPMHEAPREPATATVLCGAGSAQHGAFAMGDSGSIRR